LVSEFLSGDFNGDGLTELALVAPPDVALFGGSDGAVTQNWSVEDSLAAFKYLSDDFNGDGITDLLGLRNDFANNRLFAEVYLGPNGYEQWSWINNTRAANYLVDDFYSNNNGLHKLHELAVISNNSSNASVAEIYRLRIAPNIEASLLGSWELGTGLLRFVSGEFNPGVSISGSVGTQGTMLSIAGTGECTVTGTNYLCTAIPYGSSVTITPSKAGYSFEPLSRTHSNVVQNLTSQDFSATANLYRIYGRVRSSAGQALSGIIIAAVFDGQRVPVRHTNGNGEYEFPSLLPGTDYVVAPQGGHFDPEAGQGELTFDVIYDFTRLSDSTEMHAISGTIREAGNPLSGVTVKAVPASEEGIEFREAVSAENGAYLLSDIPHAAIYLLAPQNGQYMPASASGVLLSDITQDFKRTGPGATLHTITGRVKDQSNTPLQNIEVMLQIGSAHETVLTEANGLYGFSAKAHGSIYSLLPLGGQYEPPQVAGVLLEDVNHDFVKLNNMALYKIGGSILMADGQPVAGVLVSVGAYTALSQNDGAYAIQDIPPGLYTLSAHKTGYQLEAQFSNPVWLSGYDLHNKDFSAACAVGYVFTQGACRPQSSSSAYSSNSSGSVTSGSSSSQYSSSPSPHSSSQSSFSMSSCSSSTHPAGHDCANGVDDDRDGFIDYPGDSGCASPNDNSEANPDGPQCDDGIDNDGDKLIDMQDADCQGPDDIYEGDDFADQGCTVLLIKLEKKQALEGLSQYQLLLLEAVGKLVRSARPARRAKALQKYVEKKVRLLASLQAKASLALQELADDVLICPNGPMCLPVDNQPSVAR